MTSMSEFAQAKEKVKAAMEAARGVMKEAFNTEAKRLFEEHPTLVQFAWTQYTPYFNDGEECVFHTHGTGVWFTDSEGDLADSVYDHESNGYAIKKKSEEKRTPNDRAEVAVEDFLAIFDNSDLKELFGDHVQVNVSRAGVTTEEYEHD